MMHRNVLAPVIAASLLLAACGGSSDSPGSPPGPMVDVVLTHNALVYDAGRNAYYASVPGSVIGHGNSIATIDPASRAVSYSAPVGSEPNVLAISSDGSVLYVGLDGSGELTKLALPSMAEVGRVRFPSDAFSGQSHAKAIAASPVDPAAVAVALTGFGVGLVRDMVLQPRLASPFEQNNLLAFDSAGALIFSLDTSSTAEGLRRLAVLADGVTEQALVRSSIDSTTLALSFANGRVIAGRWLYDSPALAAAGAVSGASDCLQQRSGTLILCLDFPDPSTRSARLLLADPGNLVILASLLCETSGAGFPRKLVEGPAGQIAISYPANLSGSASKIRIFSSDQLLSAPAPQPAAVPVTSSSAPEGQVLDVGLVHNALAYDAGRNVYYASVPGSVIGAGNSIATLDPATGQVTHSAPIGSDPNALALASDGSVLYVSLDGSGEVLRLALPSMAAQARVRLAFDPQFNRARISYIAVSPADATVAAVTTVDSGVALLRDMVVQPQVASAFSVFGTNLLAFDTAGSTLYGLDSASTEFGLRRFDVLADGVAEQAKVIAPIEQGVRALSFAGARVIAGKAVYDAPALNLKGTVSGASDCLLARAGGQLLCLTSPSFPSPGPAHLLLASPDTFVISASLLFYASEPQGLGRQLVQGPSGQVAVSYPLPGFFRPPSVRLFTSAQLP
jgi:DNA-binding beta-propeller fold protein YncE